MRTGLQGEVPALGYRCRIRPVAVNDLDGNGVDTQMTWHDDCRRPS